jgi:succinate dehydrogenase flavin-adding protein (antitoxin of CptAB toxin-antitoxin module)
LRKEFAEKLKYRRLEDEDLDDFETVVEIDDPYALLATPPNEPQEEEEQEFIKP